MRTFHESEFDTPEEHNERLKAIMAMNERVAKCLPRVVYDRKNDTVNVYTAKDGFVWKK